MFLFVHSAKVIYLNGYVKQYLVPFQGSSIKDVLAQTDILNHPYPPGKKFGSRLEDTPRGPPPRPWILSRPYHVKNVRNATYFAIRTTADADGDCLRSLKRKLIAQNFKRLTSCLEANPPHPIRGRPLLVDPIPPSGRGRL